MSKNNNGFTLIEIAVVILIIAALVAGITTATNLSKSSEVQSVIADIENYKRVAQLFKKKYKALPGDIPNATSFWGTASGCPDITATTTAAPETFNGNGDGFITSSTGTAHIVGVIGTDYDQEHLRVWQHLGSAGLIPGKYTGAYHPTESSKYKPGINIPKSKLRKNGYDMHYAATSYSATVTFDGKYGHVIIYGTGYNPNGSTVYSTTTPGLSPAEALQIDLKIDDGKPGTGNVMTFKTSTSGGINNCITTSTIESTATYDGSRGDRLDCVLIFKTGF